MGSMKTRSMRSLKSAKSIDDKDLRAEESTLKFEALLPQVCLTYCCPLDVVVFKERQKLDNNMLQIQKKSSIMKKKRSNYQVPLSTQTQDPKNPSVKVSIKDFIPERTTVVTAVYDYLDRLVGLSINNQTNIHRILIQVIGLLAPQYDTLAKISITRCRIDTMVIYEMGKCLETSFVTEICLDDCPLPQANYALLLDKPTRLRSLSLCRCRINDQVCESIAVKLHYSEPGDCLCLLHLTSNQITDIGAKHLADALRTNRHLRYLNLSGNRITDEGAASLLEVLIEFPLTYDDIIDKKWCYMKYLRHKRTLFEKFFNELQTLGNQVATGKTNKQHAAMKRKESKVYKLPANPNETDNLRRKELLNFKLKAAMLTEKTIGPFKHAFTPDLLVSSSDGYVYCTGNSVLSYLNLMYNNLTYLILKKIVNVLSYQKVVCAPGMGLVMVKIEGNSFPQECDEFKFMNDYFGSKMTSSVSKRQSRRKSRLSATSTASRKN